MFKIKRKGKNNKEAISIIEHIIPILTFLSTIFTSAMIATKYIAENNNLKKHLIFNKSLIRIDLNEVISIMFIAIIVAVIFVIIFFMIKNNNNNVLREIFIIGLLILNSFLIYYDAFFKYNISVILFEMLLSTMIWCFILKRVKLKNRVEDSATLIIAIIITIVLLPLLTSLTSMFNSKSTIFLSKRNDIYIAKEKSNTEFSDKIVIYQTNEYSVLCNYNYITTNNSIKTECSTYQVVSNDELIFERYNK